MNNPKSIFLLKNHTEINVEKASGKVPENHQTHTTTKHETSTM